MYICLYTYRIIILLNIFDKRSTRLIVSLIYLDVKLDYMQHVNDESVDKYIHIYVELTDVSILFIYLYIHNVYMHLYYIYSY